MAFLPALIAVSDRIPITKWERDMHQQNLTVMTNSYKYINYLRKSQKF